MFPAVIWRRIRGQPNLRIRLTPLKVILHRRRWVGMKHGMWTLTLEPSFRMCRTCGIFQAMLNSVDLSLGFDSLAGRSGGPGSGFGEALGNRGREQFTVVILTYQRGTVFSTLKHGSIFFVHLNKVVVLWNSPLDLLEDMPLQKIHVPIFVCIALVSSLDNRFSLLMSLKRKECSVWMMTFSCAMVRLIWRSVYGGEWLDFLHVIMHETRNT